MKLLALSLTNLQDARYCAAAGFDYLGFSLERGSMRKLSVPMIWNIVQWTNGPETALQLNIDSLEELDEAETTFPFGVVILDGNLPDDVIHELLERPSVQGKPVLFTWGIESPRSDWETLIEEYENAFLLITADDEDDLTPYWEDMEHIVVHFSDLEAAARYVQSDCPRPYAIAIGAEANDADGLLDYTAVDDFMEVFLR